MELEALRKYVDLVFNWEATGQDEALARWVREKNGAGVAMGWCLYCKKDTPFYFTYCLSCGDRERSIPTMESTIVQKTAAEKAMEAKIPFVFFGRARINDKCDLHPGMGDDAYVLTLRTRPDGDSLTMCVTCARVLFESLSRDYWRETRNKQEVGELRTFWGNWHPTKLPEGKIVVAA